MRNREVFRFAAAMLCCAIATRTLQAAQIDIAGPPGSVHFGAKVALLPNGNIAIADPSGVVAGVGGVYLYTPAGTLISQVTGTTSGDAIGSGGIVVLADGNFVILSPFWHNAGATFAGAATWVNGTTGLNVVVSPVNSLVGTTKNDAVGSSVIAVPANGSYVVISSSWNGGTADAQLGAVTFADARGTTVGAVSTANSLVGSIAGDRVGAGGVRILSNGNFVVDSPYWNGGIANAHLGAVTWVDAAVGIHSTLSASNSLVGTAAGDQIGSNGVVALTNGNYVVGSATWTNNGSGTNIGAATWGSGAAGVAGSISAANSLVGSIAGDRVGSQVTALANGNYVVTAPGWSNGAAGNNFGAATWGNGATGGTVGVVTSANSLVGTTMNDSVGYYFGIAAVTALSNGNYVVASPTWNNGVPGNSVGAVTWGNGSTGTTGPVSAANSLIGTTQGDNVGSEGVTALSNGNYVAANSNWNNGVAGSHVGAATWGDGNVGTTGVISTGNSLVGTSANDTVGQFVTALTNGNYVVVTPSWSNGVAGAAYGAVTWSRGTGGGLVGPVSVANSLIGTTANDVVGIYGVGALANGNYVVCSPYWSNGAVNGAGAVTWGNGTSGVAGAVSVKNSLIGANPNTNVGFSGIFSLAANRYATTSSVGLSFGDGDFGLVGTAQAWNSVADNDFNPSVDHITYDAVRNHFVVGRPNDNIVSIVDPDQIFNGRFD